MHQAAKSPKKSQRRSQGQHQTNSPCNEARCLNRQVHHTPEWPNPGSRHQSRRHQKDRDDIEGQVHVESSPRAGQSIRRLMASGGREQLPRLDRWRYRAQTFINVGTSQRTCTADVTQQLYKYWHSTEKSLITLISRRENTRHVGPEHSERNHEPRQSPKRKPCASVQTW